MQAARTDRWAQGLAGPGAGASAHGTGLPLGDDSVPALASQDGSRALWVPWNPLNHTPLL